MFDIIAGTQAGVVRLDGGVERLGLADHRISAVHAFRDRAGDVVVLAGTYGDGLYRSADLGRTWTPITDGMTAPAARTIGPDPLAPGGLICGTEPGRIFRSSDEGLSWTELDGIRALPEHEEWYLPYSPRAGAVRNVYAPPGGRGDLFAACEVGGLLHTTDGGATWSIGPIGPNDDIHQVTGHPDDPLQLWASLGYAALRSRQRGEGAPALGGVGRSRDGGRTWDVLHTDYTRSTIVPGARPDLVLAGPAPEVGAKGRIEVSADGGETWEPASDGIDTPMPDMVELFRVAPDGTVFAICSRGRLLRSDPGPWRWTSALPAGQSEDVVSVSFLEG
ncbi:MAG TPA: sialidase family protein [Candidatus Dormibacteraeota bacterium]|nr:sialidase family protein [Candidatus Dormibacteraeota bacterium]